MKTKTFVIQWLSGPEAKIEEFDNEREAIDFIEKEMLRALAVGEDFEVITGRRRSLTIKWIKDFKYNAEIK